MGDWQTIQIAYCRVCTQVTTVRPSSWQWRTLGAGASRVDQWRRSWCIMLVAAIVVVKVFLNVTKAVGRTLLLATPCSPKHAPLNMVEQHREQLGKLSCNNRGQQLWCEQQKYKHDQGQSL